MLRAALLLGALAALLAPAPAGAAYVASGQLGKTGGGVLRYPQAIVADPADGGAWVADQHSFLVQRFDAQGRFVRQVGGYGQGAGQLGRVSVEGTIGGVGGLAVGSGGALYVLDSFNDRIQQFTAAGTFVRQWGTTGTAPGQFQLGLNGGIAVRGAYLYVADQNNHRVQRFTLGADAGAPVGTPLTFGTLGVADGQLQNPAGIAIDAATGDVFVADNRNERVQRFSADGAYEAKVGSFGRGNGQFNSPYDVGVENGRLYVADNESHRVQRFDAQTLAFQASFGTFGTAPGQIGFPRSLAALAVGTGGQVFVGDTSNNRVQRFSSEGGLQATFGESGRAPGNFTIPGGVAVLPGGDLLVADTVQHRIQRVTAAGVPVRAFGKLSTLGTPTSGAADGEFREPQNVATTPDGGFWVADTGQHRVQRFNADGSFALKAGGTAQGTAPGQFRAPRGLAVEPDGDLVVGDTGNDRIQRRDARTGAWTVMATGVSKPTGVGVLGDGRIVVAETDANRLLILSPAGAPVGSVTGLSAPEGVAVAPGQTVFVTETGADRIARLTPHRGGYRTVERFGSGRGGTAGSFAAPAGLAWNPTSRRLWIADRYNNRVQRFVYRG